MKQMVIGFVTGGLPFNGNTLNERGLGGSETALLCVARELAKRGHRVAVFCVCDAPGTYDDVDYYPLEAFGKISSFINWDVLVASRWPEYLTAPTQAGLRILWCHDTIVDKQRIWNTTWQTDEIMLLSDYHIADYIEGETQEELDAKKIPELKEHIWKTSNGVDLGLIDANRRPKVPGKVIFTSRPERGLHYLLQHVLPELIKEFPEVKLHYANYSLGSMQVSQQHKQLNHFCEHLAKSMPNNVVNLGHLTKEELYQEISSAELMLYPTEFPEISCITAMEAAACGTPIISTNAFALQETVAASRTGYLINGKPSDGEAYFARFNRKALMLLRDEALRTRMGREGREWILEKGFTWPQVAESWEKRWFALMDNRFNDRESAVIDELVRNHDLVMASQLAVGLSLGFRATQINHMIDSVKAVAGVCATDLDVKNAFKTSMPRFHKLALFMQQAKIDPKNLWDFACGDSSFGLYFAQASKKCQVLVIDRNKEVVDRVLTYGTTGDLDLSNLSGFAAPTLMFARELLEEDQPQPDTIFLGDIVDMVEAPWALLNDALTTCKPGGHVIFTTRYGPETATMPKSHNRLWNLEQQDFFEMFGADFNGEMTFMEEGISPGGDRYGHWLCWIPVPEEPITITPLSPERRARVTRPYETLTVSMIGKDEERWAAMCLERIAPIADKIRIVLDSRTTDHTAEILKWFDDEDKVDVIVHDFEDFGRQRNESIKDNNTDWTLWIDFDERMTDPENLRKYLRSKMFEGFSMKQCHLMLDLHGTFDVPIRLLRNRPQYKFVGCIHEHCEDTSKGYDSPINPAMLLPDVSLAHYGYMNEKNRRLKCSNRNMALLQKDVEENGKKGRKLTWVLVIRDHLNIVKWRVDKHGHQVIQRGSDEHMQLEAAVATFLHHFPDPSVRYYQLAWPMFQEALKIFGLCQIPVANRKTPPFSVSLGLAGSVGADARDDVKAKVAWFIDQVAYMEFIERQSKLMLGMLGVVEKNHYSDDLAKPSEVEFNYNPHSQELLSMGVGAIDETTGKLR